MTYVRYENRQTVAWASGTGASPVATYSYRVSGLSVDMEKSIALQNASFIGKDYPAAARPGGRYIDLSFQCEFRGSGTNSVPCPEGALLRACGMSETANGYGFIYAIADTHLDSGVPAGETDAIDLAVYQDGLYRLCDECVGNVVFNFEAGQIPTMDFTFRGIVVTAREGGIEDFSPPTYTVGENPVPVQYESLTLTQTRDAEVAGTVTGTSSTTVLIASTSTFWDDGVYAGDAIELTVGGETATVVSVDSQTQLTSTALSGAGEYDSGEAFVITKANLSLTSLVVPRLTYDMGNILGNRPDVSGGHGFSAPIIPGRDPRYTMLVEQPDLTDYNFEYEYYNNSEITFTHTHEQDLGVRHEVAISWTGILAEKPTTVVQNGKLMYQLVFDQSDRSGATVFTLTWKGA